MPQLSEAIQFLESFAPPALSEEWDNTGLLVGRRAARISRVLTCLTLTRDVAQEAIDLGVNLIITHHPVLFRGTKQVSDDTAEGEMLLSLIESKIAVYSPHTSFDSAAGGINQQLAEKLGLSNIAVIRPSEKMEGVGAGAGRIGDLSRALGFEEFLIHAKTALDTEYLEYSEQRSHVSRVAFACGSAAEYLRDAVVLGADTFVTGEARFHAALEARSLGVNLVLLGHYSSERPAVEQLARIIEAEFPALKVAASQVESDPISLYK